MQNAACFPISQEPGGTTLNQLTKLRLADGAEVAIVDWTWRPLYSCIDTLTSWTDVELRAFTYSEGDPITVSSNMTVRETATLMHTNIKVPAEMDSQEELIVYSIQIEFYRMVEDTGNSVIDYDTSLSPIAQGQHLLRLHAQCIGELEVSQKDYQVASIGWFSTGFGLSSIFNQARADAAASAVTTANSGLPSREAIDQFPVPVHIGATEKYAFLLHNPTGRAVVYADTASPPVEIANSVYRLRVNLHGLHKRPSG